MAGKFVNLVAYMVYVVLLLFGGKFAHSQTDCTSPADPGMCMAYVPSYFFNINSKKCEQFIWGGCQGNSNRFSSVEACRATCDGSVLTTITTTNNQFSCSNTTIGRCNEPQNSPDSYPIVTPYLQVYMNLQAQIDGSIDNIQFIDKTPAAGKTFYLTVWQINGLGPNSFDPVTGAITVDTSQVSITLTSITPATTNGQSGWQKFTFSNKPAIKRGQYLGLHQLSTQALFTQCIVPYTISQPTMPTVTVAVDQSILQLIANVLPQSANFLSMTNSNNNFKSFKYYVDKRRPALTATITPTAPL